MNQSTCSKASNASSQMLEELANRSMTSKIFRAEGTFNDEEMRLIWNAMGLYISRNLRMGRGVSVPKLGIFTFTPPEVRLKGVTNQKERDLKPRTPVFLIQKEFVKGLPLRSAIFYHQDFGLGLRPYAALGATGDVPITKMNLIEISSYANMSKDATELGINRIIKFISTKMLAGQNVNLEIPNVGQLISRNNLVAVKFNDFLHRDTRTILSKSVDERKQRGNMSLTSDNLKKFARLNEMNQKLSQAPDEFLDIDEKTKSFLRTDYGFHFNSARDPMKNSLTDFGRSYASREFDLRNNTLKNSQMSRMTQSGFLTNKVRSFNREYNMALKLVKEWVVSSCKDTKTAFKQFAALSGKKSEVINENQVWEACKKISQDITEQQAHELFRLLDQNKDGLVTRDDWEKSIDFDTNDLIKSTVELLRRRNYSASVALKKMGLEGMSSVGVHNLRESLQKINDKLSDDQAMFLSRYICKGKPSVPIENVLEILHLADSGSSGVDQQWEEKFLQRLKKKIYDKGVMEEEFENKLRFYDSGKTGYIDQTDLKQVLGSLGVSLTLSELVKIVKVFPINEHNQIHYLTLIDKLNFSDAQGNDPITYDEFLKVISESFLPSLPVTLPISVRKLTSELQASLFKGEEESHLIKFVRKLDFNGDDQISEEDIVAFRQSIRPAREYKAEHQCKVHLDELIMKMREKSIKKKISFYDFFSKIDTNKDGFITLDEWNKNLDQVLPLSAEEKELLFNYIDKSQNRMIDYKTFLAFMNGTGSTNAESEKFDWIEQCFARIKEWYQGSGLPIHKSFKLVDRDGDSYISETDLHDFLIEKIKYQPRELSHVRLQKFLKVMDGFKRGKVDETDWERVLGEGKIDWVADARQQIGIVISRQYGSLNEAFYDITQGDSKLIFSAFKSWVEKKKALSGFIANEDIIKKIFSALDSHKKGYLVETDFVAIFGVYNWKSEQTKEFLEKIRGKFTNPTEAYKCMNAYAKNKLDFNRFLKFTEEVFGTRFKKLDVKNIWRNIAGSASTLSLQEFEARMEGVWADSSSAVDKEFPRDDWQYEDFSIIKGTTLRNTEYEYNETENVESQVRKIVKNVKQILAASPKSLEQAFSQADTEKTGKLNNLQFKKAVRSLNIAITSKEIDLLLNYCDYKVDTLIDWKEFIKRFKLNTDEVRVNERIQPKLQHLSDLLHYYMVSPKDAFRKWNNPRTSYMNFEEFHKMVRDLYHQGSEPLPELAILKEIFEHIDIRKDNQLDFQEFTQTFRNCTPPSLLMGTVPAAGNLKNQSKEDLEKDKPVREKEIPQFKHSPEYEEFVKFMGRNRKYLQERIEEEVGKEERLVPFVNVKKVIQGAASHNKLSFSDNVIRNSIAFAMTGEKVDYRLLLENFKGRGESIVEFPLKKVF